jgi:cytidylate kinase
VVVTISSQYGAGAVSIGSRLAQRLGYRLVDRQLPVVVSKRLRVPRADVEASEDPGNTMGERFLQTLELGTPEMAAATLDPPFDRELLEGVQRAVRDYAQRGNVIILGRAAGLILGPSPSVLRVYLHAPIDARIAHVVETMGVARDVAAREVERIDKARRAYLKDWYGATLGDPENVELSLDTSAYSLDGAVEIVAASVGART